MVRIYTTKYTYNMSAAMDMDTDCCKDSICYILNSLLLYVYPCVVVEFTVGFPTFPLDAVVLLAGLVWQGIGA